MLGSLQRILPDFASYGDVELLQRFLFLGVREIKVVDVRKLDCRLAKEGKVWRLSFVFRKKGNVSHECYFGRRLLAGSRFEQERAQLDRSGERDAYDAALDCERYWQTRVHDLQLIVRIRLDILWES